MVPDTYFIGKSFDRGGERERQSTQNSPVSYQQKQNSFTFPWQNSFKKQKAVIQRQQPPLPSPPPLPNNAEHTSALSRRNVWEKKKKSPIEIIPLCFSLSALSSRRHLYPHPKTPSITVQTNSCFCFRSYPPPPPRKKKFRQLDVSIPSTSALTASGVTPICSVVLGQGTATATTEDTGTALTGGAGSPPEVVGTSCSHERVKASERERESKRENTSGWGS